MKKLFLFGIFILLTSFVVQPHNKIDKQEDAVKLLKKISERLNEIQEISYDYKRELHYFSEDYHAELSGKTYLKFDKSNADLGFVFQFDNAENAFIYNGTEYFYLFKKDKTKDINRTPKKEDFENSSFLTNSLVTLKNALPEIISNKSISKSISDTIINKKSYYFVTFVIKNGTLNSLGDFNPITLERNFFYKIIVDKSSFLPLQIVQTNNVEPKDYVKTSFTNIKTNGIAPKQKSWFYSFYSNFSKKASADISPVKIGSSIENFSLPYFSSNKKFNLSDHKKLVLIEFWIKNCGNCIESVPKLNAIAEKYKDNIEFISINGYDSKENIEKFYAKNKPIYPTLIDANAEITKKFGVNGFPHTFVLDQNQKVIFSGEIDAVKIQKLIDQEWNTAHF